MIRAIFTFLIIIGSLNGCWAQLRLPQVSPLAGVSQIIGQTEVKVKYHSPGVKGRDIWGKLVPYGQVWRAGANEATLIRFSDDVKINGESVEAGTYPLFLLPEKQDAWSLVLNRDTTLWGTENYQDSLVVLKAPVRAQDFTFHESPQYYFSDIKANSANLNLVWEKYRFPMTIEVEVLRKTIAYLIADLAKVKPDDWNSYAQAAHFLIQQNKEHELALAWINKSLRIKENFYNNWLKAQLLAQKDEYEEAVNLTKKAIKLGEKNDKTYSQLSPIMERSMDEWKVKMLNQN